jgi:hypothetical protein
MIIATFAFPSFSRSCTPIKLLGDVLLIPGSEIDLAGATFRMIISAFPRIELASLSGLLLFSVLLGSVMLKELLFVRVAG